MVMSTGGGKLVCRAQKDDFESIPAERLPSTLTQSCHSVQALSLVESDAFNRARGTPFGEQSITTFTLSSDESDTVRGLFHELYSAQSHVALIRRRPYRNTARVESISS